jgi:tRNA threonylcarbamoyladenosine biosynthesis protein TsaE
MVTKGEIGTRKLSARVCRELLKERPRGAPVVGLVGDLGAGKTAFVKGCARAMGVRGRVVSPTFLIFRSYPVPRAARFSHFYHVDAYRLRTKRELDVLGFSDIIKNPNNIIFIEWADRIERYLPKGTVWVWFAHGDKENERLITCQTFNI